MPLIAQADRALSRKGGDCEGTIPTQGFFLRFSKTFLLKSSIKILSIKLIDIDDLSNDKTKFSMCE